MTSFHAEKCRRLASKQEASVGTYMQQLLPVPDLYYIRIY